MCIDATLSCWFFQNYVSYLSVNNSTIHIYRQTQEADFYGWPGKCIPNLGPSCTTGFNLASLIVSPSAPTSRLRSIQFYFKTGKNHILWNCL